ncbi:hypothetical protein IAR55_004524 [Kwoniella newhampshirensis]|uniref:Protein kinase domain-containing protein n=1 Tax=Kwoniella newhampshirensis TaxID=1651941 RepID=A0AAW0YVH0_9TREE
MAAPNTSPNLTTMITGESELDQKTTPSDQTPSERVFIWKRWSIKRKDKPRISITQIFGLDRRAKKKYIQQQQGPVRPTTPPPVDSFECQNEEDSPESGITAVFSSNNGDHDLSRKTGASNGTSYSSGNQAKQDISQDDSPVSVLPALPQTAQVSSETVRSLPHDGEVETSAVVLGQTIEAIKNGRSGTEADAVDTANFSPILPVEPSEASHATCSDIGSSSKEQSPRPIAMTSETSTGPTSPNTVDGFTTPVQPPVQATRSPDNSLIVPPTADLTTAVSRSQTSIRALFRPGPTDEHLESINRRIRQIERLELGWDGMSEILGAVDVAAPAVPFVWVIGQILGRVKQVYVNQSAAFEVLEMIVGYAELVFGSVEDIRKRGEGLPKGVKQCLVYLYGDLRKCESCFISSIPAEFDLWTDFCHARKRGEAISKAKDDLIKAKENYRERIRLAQSSSQWHIAGVQARQAQEQAKQGRMLEQIQNQLRNDEREWDVGTRQDAQYSRNVCRLSPEQFREVVAGKTTEELLLFLRHVSFELSDRQSRSSALTHTATVTTFPAIDPIVNFYLSSPKFESSMIPYDKGKHREAMAVMTATAAMDTGSGNTSFAFGFDQHRFAQPVTSSSFLVMTLSVSDYASEHGGEDDQNGTDETKHLEEEIDFLQRVQQELKDRAQVETLEDVRNANVTARTYKAMWRNREVCVKEVDGMSDEAFARQRDAWKAAADSCPRVLPLLGSSGTGKLRPKGNRFFVTPFIENGNFEQYLASERGKSVNVFELVRDLAQVMADLHAQKISHDNLHWTNLLIDDDGRVLLTEPYNFGVEGSGSGDVKAFGQMLSKINDKIGVPDSVEDPSHYLRHLLRKTKETVFRRKLGILISDCTDYIGFAAPTFQQILSELDELSQVLMPPISKVPLSDLSVAEFSTMNRALRDLLSSRADSNKTAVEIPASTVGLHTYELYKKGVYNPSLPGFQSSDATAVDPSPDPRYYQPLKDLVDPPSPSIYTNSLRTYDNFKSISERDSRLQPLKDLDSYIRSSRSASHPDVPMSKVRPDSYTQGKRIKSESAYREFFRWGSLDDRFNLPLWSPATVRPGDIGYVKKGEFVSIGNMLEKIFEGSGPPVTQRSNMRSSTGSLWCRVVSRNGTSTPKNRLAGPLRSVQSLTRKFNTQPVLVSLFPDSPQSVELVAANAKMEIIKDISRMTQFFQENAVDIVRNEAEGISKSDLLLVVGTVTATDWAMAVCEFRNHAKLRFNIHPRDQRYSFDAWGSWSLETDLDTKYHSTPYHYDVKVSEPEEPRK